MIDFTIDLFPNEDLYTKLKHSDKPILVYGMGDGAAKIINVLRARNIEVKGIFASDEFVRGQSFMGYTVKRFVQLEVEFPDPLILVAFSSKLAEVREKVDCLRKKYELYVPDVNVSGDFFEVFDRDFLLRNFDLLNQSFDLLSDNESKTFFIDLIRYKLSGDLLYLDKLNCRDMISDLKPDALIDMGAYVGDTVIEYTKRFPSIKKIIAYEPDKRHYKKLCDILNQREGLEAYPINAASSDTSSVVDFSDNEGRGSGHESYRCFDGFRPVKAKPVVTAKLDDMAGVLSSSTLPLLKIDVEGMEEKAIRGAKSFIKEKAPMMIVSLYHNNRDIFRLPILLSELCKDSFFYLSRKQVCFPAWEVELTIIPKLVYNQQNLP